MQFPVPQFTDVEDKIIGPLTIKQFGIVFGAGMIVFLAYSVTKSVLVAIFFFVLFGVPALGLAFAKINGRPIYNSIGYFAKFITSPKVLVFHKEAANMGRKTELTNVEIKQPEQKQEPISRQNTAENLKKIQQLLAKTASEEKEIVDNIK